MADYIKKRTHIINHPRLLKAGALGRDLYDWSMLYSGLIESDGELDEVAVLSTPYGAGGKKNAKLAEHLVEVGLWERTPTGFRILRWAEQGNVTKADLERARTEARDRMRKKRGGGDPPPSAPPPASPSPNPVRANIERTSPEVPTYTSPFNSETDLGGGAGEGPPTLDGPMPEWAAGRLAAIAMSTGAKLDGEIVWAKYVSNRGNPANPRPMNAFDFNGWLCDQVRIERRDKERERDIAAERAARPPSSGYLPRGGLLMRDPPPPAPSAKATSRLVAQMDAEADAAGTLEERKAAAQKAMLEAFG